jgi:hypothetical protein
VGEMLLAYSIFSALLLFCFFCTGSCMGDILDALMYAVVLMHLSIGFSSMLFNSKPKPKKSFIRCRCEYYS